MCINLSTGEYIQLATLLVVIIYTFVTYRLLAAQGRQSFENKFFQLLNLHHEIVGAIERYVGPLPVRGRRNFQTYYDEFLSNYKNEYAKNPNEEPLKIIQRAYVSFFSNRQPDIGHYFRNLYHIIKYVDASDNDNKNFYTHLVRAQLSSHELLLLFYNCLGPYGIEKFKPLIERYSLLENMPEDELASLKNNEKFDHRTLYNPKAFSKD
jgi:hypothetical protein